MLLCHIESAKLLHIAVDSTSWLPVYNVNYGSAMGRGIQLTDRQQTTLYEHNLSLGPDGVKKKYENILLRWNSSSTSQRLHSRSSSRIFQYLPVSTFDILDLDNGISPRVPFYYYGLIQISARTTNHPL